MSLQVLPACTGCGRCVAACPEKALSLETESPDGFGEKKAVVNLALCKECGKCIAVCPYGALELKG